MTELCWCLVCGEGRFIGGLMQTGANAILAGEQTLTPASPTHTQSGQYARPSSHLRLAGGMQNWAFYEDNQYIFLNTEDGDEYWALY